MEWSDVIRISVMVLGVVGTLAVTLMGIVIGRLYKSVDVLFGHIGRQDKRITVLELAALKSDPESTVLFRALTASGNGHHP